MEKKLLTVKGLGYMTYASLIAISWGLMSLIMFVYYYTNESYNDGIVWLTGFYLTLYLIGVVLFIIGLYRMWEGRNEFGKEHTLNLEKTLWLALVILAVSAFVSGPLTMFGFSSTIISIITFFLATVLILIIPLYLIKSLSTHWVKNMLFIGVSFFIVIYLVSIIMRYILGFYYWDISLRTLSVLSDLIPYTLLFIAYYKTLLRVKNEKIKTTW